MKSVLHKITHRIKNTLAARYDLAHLKKWAFFISLASCLSSGSIMLFSLFSSALHHAVGLSYTQINFIVSLSAVGMYLCLPVLGYLADCYGPALLSLISIWAFCPAYFVNASLVKAVATTQKETSEISSGHVAVMAVSFCFIGLATSSLYFSSLLTCARIYPNHKSLAISMPVSCYGLSSLIGAQILKVSYFHDRDNLDLYKVFSFFSVLYLVMGALNLVANSIVTIEQEVIFGETEPLLDSEDLHPSTSLEPADHHQRYINFLKDKSAWVMLVALFFCVGPLESFQNNLGSILEATTGSSDSLSNQVSIIAASSTAIRLLIGVAADWISSEERKFPICKVWLLMGLVVVGAFGQIAALFHVDASIVSMLSGISYGGIFTTMPTIVAIIWGVDLMGSTWGSFMVAPAIGSITFSLLHGRQMDSCRDEFGCLDDYFRVTSVCLAVSVLFVAFVWRGMWWKRGFRCF